MFSKFLTASSLVLALALQVHAHGSVVPLLGVSGTPVRGDVKRPSDAEPCGAGVNIASEIDSSTAVAAGADGSVALTALDFNAGTDGSREFSGKVDPTGTGKNFVPITISKNGIEDPTSVASQPLVANLPAGTKCTGGATKDKCLLQFISTAGFGNCVVVSQGAASGAAKAAGSAADVVDAGAAGAAAKKGKKGGKKGKKGGKKDKKAKKAKRAGTTAARALIYDLEDRVDEGVEVVKRSINWIWA